MPDTYKVLMVCDNCGWRGHAIIPKGTRVTQFCTTTRCWCCGCLELRRIGDEVPLSVMERFKARVKGLS